MSEEIIPFHVQTINAETVQTVDARELHEFLGVGKDFSTWIRGRIKTYTFLESIDFIKLPRSGEQNNNPAIDYFISIDMAKELAMVERTPRGKDARQYFIACEKRLKIIKTTPQTLPLPKTTYEVIAETTAALAFLKDIDCLEPRDKLMAADRVRNVALLPASPSTPALVSRVGFQSMERVAQLGYRLTRKQAAALSGPLGKKLKAEHITRYGEVPPTVDRFVDGAVRPVCWYRPEDADWIDPIVQAFFAGFPGVERNES